MTTPGTKARIDASATVKSSEPAPPPPKPRWKPMAIPDNLDSTFEIIAVKQDSTGRTGTDRVYRWRRGNYTTVSGERSVMKMLEKCQIWCDRKNLAEDEFEALKERVQQKLSNMKALGPG